eukprot:12374491-Prorocentrum_lima.AAC.1
MLSESYVAGVTDSGTGQIGVFCRAMDPETQLPAHNFYAADDPSCTFQFVPNIYRILNLAPQTRNHEIIRTALRIKLETLQCSAAHSFEGLCHAMNIRFPESIH